MKPLAAHVLRDHVFLGGIVAFFLIPHLGLAGALIFWASTVLVDIDHYFRFVSASHYRAFGLKKMFHFFERCFQVRNSPEFLVLEIFHTVEFLAVFALVSFFVFPALQPVLWGFLFHMLVDFFHLLRYKALTKRTYSFAQYFWLKHRFRKQGRDPDRFFTQIFESGD